MKTRITPSLQYGKMSICVRGGIVVFILLAACALYTVNPRLRRVEAQNGCVAALSGLVAWYPFEGNGYDIQGGNNATLYGSATFASGKVGQALQFDGATTSAKVSASSTINVGASNGMTIDTWINPADVSAQEPVFEWNNGGNSGSPYGVHLWISVTSQGGAVGNLLANIVDTAGNFHIVQTSGGLVKPNTFQHVALTYDKSDGTHGYASIYLNGVAQALNNTSSTVVDIGVFTPRTSDDLYFGFRPTDGKWYYKGLLDELEIYNRALSQTEIQNIFSAGSSPRCAPPDRIQFRSATYSHIAQGNALLAVTRTNTQSAAAVQYATSDGTATAGVDYAATSGTLNFAAGESSKTISVPITPKTIPGPDKTVNVTLSNPTGDGVLGTPTTAVLTIAGSLGRILLEQGNADLQNIAAINSDAGGSNRINLTDLRYGNFTQYPSASAKTGMIAFQGCGNDFPSPSDCAGGRIFVMNSDASGVKQLTSSTGLQNPNDQGDHSPVISPDGTKVAFVSGRSRYPVDAAGNTQNDEVFVVNVDGTGLHQVTMKQNISSDNSRAYSVAWGADSSKLVVRGTRLYREAVNGDHMVEEVFTVNLDGSGEKVLATAGVGANDLHAGDQNFPLADKVVDWSPDGANILFAANYAPASNTSGIIDYVIMNPANPSTYHLITSDKLGSPAASAFDGSVRFSPDGQQIVYGLRDDSSIRRINLDGTNQFTMVSNDAWATGPKWWMGGPAIPQPARFTLTPNPVRLFSGVKQQVTPTLYDSDGNVIAHAGVYTDGLNFNGSPFIDFFFLITPSNSDPRDFNLCASNAGLNGCTTVQETSGTALLSVTPTAPTTFTSGKSGPGVFTVKRAGDANAPHYNDAIAFTIQMGGTAQRDVDYSLDFSGNIVTLPANQPSVDIKVRPLFNSSRRGDKTVTLTIQPDPQNTYVTDSTSSGALTIKDDGGSTAFSLSSVTPKNGGDKGTTLVTVFGQNIQQGATIKLTRAGQSDFVGLSARVAANGSSVGSIFNLTGAAQGAWDVVVVNPDNTTLKLPNAFTVQPAEDPHIWVDLMGRSAIRASHTATTYTLAYGNRGNTDAFMVPLFVTGIPSGAEVKLLTDVAPVPGGAPENEIPPILSNGTMQSIMVFVPYVPANSTGYLRFSIRFSHLGVSDSFTLTAYAFSSFVEPAPSTQSGGTSNASAVTRRGGKVRPLGQPNTQLILQARANLDACLIQALTDLLNCMLTVTLGPGAGFIACGQNFAASLAGTANALMQSYVLGNTINPVSGFSIAAGWASTLVSCLNATSRIGIKLVLPSYTALSWASCLVGIIPDLFSCYQAYVALMNVATVASSDPNEKIGSRGITEQHYISGLDPSRYAIYFENKPDATAPAQTVLITDQLDTSRFDLSTFSLGMIGFSDKVINVPPGLSTYSADVDLRPAKNLIVRVQAALDSTSGIVTWKFQSIDPATNQPTTDPAAGFLPPDTDGIVGEGSVLFTVQPKAGLSSGTIISNKASVTFDLNSPLDTNTFTNTIDNSLPVSHVNSLAANQQSVIFPVTWGGTDTGSGVGSYTVYVSANGTDYSIWLANTTATSANFIGQPNTTYSFYAVARDMANNVEAAKSGPEATSTTTNAVISSGDDARYFVRQQYLDFLNREPEQAGWDAWTGYVQGCAQTDYQCLVDHRVTASSGFFRSPEFFSTGYFVMRMYRATLYPHSGTDLPAHPTFEEFVTDAPQVKYGVAGDTLAASKLAFAQNWVQRADFLAMYPATMTTGDFIDKLAQTAQITLTASQRAQMLTETRAQIVIDIVDNPQVDVHEYNSAFVTMQYMGYLRRMPEAKGYSDWLGYLNQNPDKCAVMIYGFVYSREYRERFGPYGDANQFPPASPTATDCGH